MSDIFLTQEQILKKLKHRYRNLQKGNGFGMIIADTGGQHHV